MYGVMSSKRERRCLAVMFRDKKKQCKQTHVHDTGLLECRLDALVKRVVDDSSTVMELRGAIGIGGNRTSHWLATSCYIGQGITPCMVYTLLRDSDKHRLRID